MVQHAELDFVCAALNDSEFVFLKKGPQEKKGPALYKMELSTRKCVRWMEEKKETPYPTCLDKAGTIGGVFHNQSKYEGFLSKSDGSLEIIKDFQLWGMNDSGQVVGAMIVGKELRGGVYQEGELFNINDLMLPPEKQPLAYEHILSLTGVNKSGQMIGIMSSWNTKQAVLLHPK